MATQEEKQAYVDEMVEKRGYVLDYHKVMAAQDYEVLQAANAKASWGSLYQSATDATRRSLVNDVFAGLNAYGNRE